MDLFILPHDIRYTIYRCLFRDQDFLVDVPRAQSGLAPENPAVIARRLPTILLVNKCIRSEALPVYSATMTPIYYNNFDFGAPQIPNQYLSHVWNITLANEDVALPPINQMPRLEELTIVVSTPLPDRLRLTCKLTWAAKWMDVELLELLSLLPETYTQYCGLLRQRTGRDPSGSQDSAGRAACAVYAWEDFAMEYLVDWKEGWILRRTDYLSSQGFSHVALAWERLLARFDRGF